MNNLSWMLYLAEVSESLKIVLFILSGVLLIAVLVGSIIASEICPEEKEKRCWIRVARMAVTGVVLLVIATFLPTSHTVYMIAASQYGQELSQSETIQGVSNEALVALRTWLKKQAQ